jgi:UDPglucose--hexose-1-phosphate uridylyltransferase
MLMNRQPEFRRDPVCGRWSVVAPERSNRPRTLEGAEPRHRGNHERQPCPFCPGQESETPDEVLAYRTPGSLPNSPGWQLRVVPNKFPAVSLDVSKPASLDQKEIFLTTPGFGRAEVLIECPEHVPDPTRLTDGQFAAVFRAYRERLASLAREPGLEYASVFKNVGAEAGASLGHTHSQIIATPIIPDSIQTELSGAADFYARRGKCVFCDLIQCETALGTRTIARSKRFVAIAAFAPRFDYEFWVLPARHSSRFEDTPDDACLELAQIMRRVLAALDRVLGEPAYNWFLHTAPLRADERPDYHWHFEVMPRTARPAGLEWGFGCFIATVAPERSAAELRAAFDSSGG